MTAVVGAEDDVQVVEEEDGLPNAWYDELAATLVDAPETVVLHGTRADYASGILKNNFDLEKVRRRRRSAAV